MKILHLSDTHGQHTLLTNLPDADVIIHSGDCTISNSELEITAFLNWFFTLKYKYKIFVAGNHDSYLFASNIEELPKNCFYLCNSEITIQNLKFYGLPFFVQDTLDNSYESNISKIPADIDILISHQPPYGILDTEGNTNFGNLLLLEKLLKIKPRLHLFGHIHSAYGIVESKNTTFINAAVCNQKNTIANLPILIEIEKKLKPKPNSLNHDKEFQRATIPD